MNRLLDDFTRGMIPAGRGGALGGWPQIEVSETETEVRVVAELAGLEEKDVDVSLHDGLLTIKGEKNRQSDGAFYSERWHGQFQRTLQVGPHVDPEKVRATFNNGVLSVTLAKRAESQARVRRIPITAG